MIIYVTCIKYYEYWNGFRMVLHDWILFLDMYGLFAYVNVTGINNMCGFTFSKIELFLHQVLLDIILDA